MATTNGNKFIQLFKWKSHLFEICGRNSNSTYELIEDMVNLNWLVVKNPHAKRPNAAMEQLVHEMAYFQSPINYANKNGKMCKFSIKTHVPNRPI